MSSEGEGRHFNGNGNGFDTFCENRRAYTVKKVLISSCDSIFTQYELLIKDE